MQYIDTDFRGRIAGFVASQNLQVQVSVFPVLRTLQPWIFVGFRAKDYKEHGINQFIMIG